MLPSFEDIETNSNRVENNEFFSQFTNQALPNHYDSNFVLLHYNPTLPELKLIEKMHLKYQLSIHQSHLHFYWPEATGLFVDVLDYLNKGNFEIGMQELLCIQPKAFKMTSRNEHVQVEVVEESQFDTFLALNYEEDVIHSKELADHKEKVYAYQFDQPNVQFLLASIDDHAVGSLIVIASNEYLEVDNVLTNRRYRKQGIASMLLEYVMRIADNKTKKVILVADAEDTPKDMYLKQGFTSVATQIQAQKVLKN